MPFLLLLKTGHFEYYNYGNRILPPPQGLLLPLVLSDFVCVFSDFPELIFYSLYSLLYVATEIFVLLP